MTTFVQLFAKWLKAERERSGIAAKALAERIGHESASTVYDFEKGRRRFPRTEQIDKMLREFGVSPGEMLAVMLEMFRADAAGKAVDSERATAIVSKMRKQKRKARPGEPPAPDRGESTTPSRRS
jgi:transcriptional regulator with XRE-family HTH domain